MAPYKLIELHPPALRNARVVHFFSFSAFCNVKADDSILIRKLCVSAVVEVCWLESRLSQRGFLIKPTVNQKSLSASLELPLEITVGGLIVATCGESHMGLPHF